MTLEEIHDQLVRDLLILRDLHGVPITEAQAIDRAGNIAQWVAALVDDARAGAVIDPMLGPTPDDLRVPSSAAIDAMRTVDYRSRTPDEGLRLDQLNPSPFRRNAADVADMAATLNVEPGVILPRVVSAIRRMPCDRCGKTIERDGVALQVAPEPQRMFRHYHRRCRP